MTSASTHTGIDLLGAHLRLAAGTEVSDGLIIDRLSEWSRPGEGENWSGDTGDGCFAIADDEALIRRVRIPAGGKIDPSRVAAFEMAALLLDNPDNYIFDSFALNGRNERLAVAFRRDLIERKKEHLRSGWSLSAERYKIRSLALADGYRRFFEPAGGGMICLVNIDFGMVTYCFIERDYAVAPGAFRWRRDPHDGDEIADRKLLIDLAATIHYQKAILFDAGFSVPLSTIVVTGAGARFPEMIEEKLRVKTAVPMPRQKLFPEALIPLAGDYMVSLGLLVET